MRYHHLVLLISASCAPAWGSTLAQTNALWLCEQVSKDPWYSVGIIKTNGSLKGIVTLSQPDIDSIITEFNAPVFEEPQSDSNNSSNIAFVDKKSNFTLKIKSAAGVNGYTGELNIQDHGKTILIADDFTCSRDKPFTTGINSFQ